MPSIAPMLEIQLVWFDSDMIELRLSAASENFAGSSNFYAGFNELPDLATLLEGFPASPNDLRTVAFGGNNLPGYGGAKITFRCKDSSGHLSAEVSVFMTPGGWKDAAESAIIQIDTVPAEVDHFILQLRGVGTQVGAIARLKNAT
ncbi:hypothetical protein RQP54_17405 [Curvibacter sp. APW13]|uniref:hypothetical protein n=1 Tax=Curvibacter sp. APW13 TaxID=3077236 RepID=UPI0028E053A4|nr:hypothetical protein [Curvibacter sp. APW13]MDT8992652.1 hypothetical protein [Curvibacter sp. APW13]